jgi:multidrug efflux pump subunit AcrA (membrane-fusion protein)
MLHTEAFSSDVRPWRGRWRGGATRLIVIVLIGIFLFGLWAVYFNIDELARARGQVIAVARTQVIQASQDGVLGEIYVEEGQAVVRGQLLAKMDQDRSLAAVEDSSNKVAALKASLARLRAEVYSQPLVFPADIERFTAFRENQSQLYRVRKQALQEGISAISDNRNLVLAELNITEPLLHDGDVGKAEVIRLKRQATELQGQIINLRNKFFQDAQADMTHAEEELATQEQLLRERSVLLEQTRIVAPTDGVIRKIAVTTPGAALRPGEVMMEMLPSDSELIVEAKYAPTDVAFIHQGERAEVKLDAYDSSVYGGLSGEVIYISPDALTEPDNKGGEKVYYRVQIRLDHESAKALAGAKGRIVVMPGMTVTAEIRTHKRSVFSYLTKPITKTLATALNER